MGTLKLYFRPAGKGVLVTLSDGVREYSQVYDSFNEDDLGTMRQELSKAFKGSE